MRFLRPLLLAAVLLAPCAFASTDPAILAQQIHDIFEAKCLDCHGPAVARPKGKFGYVLDLKRVAENPDYVIPGDPENSDLYQMILDDEMPGEDAKVPSLTDEEKKLVRLWVEAGAPPLAGEVGAVKAETLRPPKPPGPFWRHALRWAGRFHPVTTHFPVALLMTAALAEVLAWGTRKRAWFDTVRFLLILGTVGALGAATSGWVNASFSSYSKATWALLWWHRWFGTFTAVWAVVCVGAAFAGSCHEGTPERRRFRVALFLGAALVGITGFLGSALIFGLDHYRW